eukprot:1142893-Pelagomonas_calceolata.AAC.2
MPAAESRAKAQAAQSRRSSYIAQTVLTQLAITICTPFPELSSKTLDSADFRRDFYISPIATFSSASTLVRLVLAAIPGARATMPEEQAMIDHKALLVSDVRDSNYASHALAACTTSTTSKGTTKAKAPQEQRHHKSKGTT